MNSIGRTARVHTIRGHIQPQDIKRTRILLRSHTFVSVDTPRTLVVYASQSSKRANSPTFTAYYSTTSTETSPKSTPLKLLPRPLGIREPPRWTRLKSEEKYEQFWDPKKVEERREVLMKLNHEAYYADVHKINFHGGKRWIAPEQLIKEDRSLFFPDLSGKALTQSPPPFGSQSAEQRKEALLRDGPHIPTTDGKVHTAQVFRNNVTLIAISHSQISAEHIRAWTEGLAEKWRGHERFRFIQVNLQQNFARSLLVSLFTSRLKKEIPKYFQQSYFVSYDNVDYVRDAIGLENKYVGYVYLVDWEGRIRWAGCGGPWNGDGVQEPSPAPEGDKGGQVTDGLVSGYREVQRLEICTKVLMGRLERLIGEGKVS